MTMPINSMTEPEIKDSKSKPLFGMFNAIPKRYDQINRLITLGLDKKWRDVAAHECLGSGPRRILDLGCGTGEMAINLVRLAKTYVTIFGLDFSPEMLEAARIKADTLLGKDRIAFTQSEAASLPFANDYFDTISISFAFRNLIYKNPVANFHLAEVFRVLAPGGRLVIVESSQPKSRFIRWWFHLYLRTYVYWLGWWLSGNKGAYKYLTESTRRFFNPDEVKDLLKASGFQEITYRPLLWGAAGVHVAVK